MPKIHYRKTRLTSSVLSFTEIGLGRTDMNTQLSGLGEVLAGELLWNEGDRGDVVR